MCLTSLSATRREEAFYGGNYKRIEEGSSFLMKNIAHCPETTYVIKLLG